MRRRTLIISAACLPAAQAIAHHGWSSFDQSRPIYLEGRASKVAWRNPHVEFELDVRHPLALPADWKDRKVPAQSAGVDGVGLMAKAALPTRRDTRWTIELAPLTRMEAWKVPPIQVGQSVGILGFTFEGEKGEPVLRAEYLFLASGAYALRSGPA